MYSLEGGCGGKIPPPVFVAVVFFLSYVKCSGSGKRDFWVFLSISREGTCLVIWKNQYEFRDYSKICSNIFCNEIAFADFLTFFRNCTSSILIQISKYIVIGISIGIHSLEGRCGGEIPPPIFVTVVFFLSDEKRSAGNLNFTKNTHRGPHPLPTPTYQVGVF